MGFVCLFSSPLLSFSSFFGSLACEVSGVALELELLTEAGRN